MESINAKLALVMKSGKALLGYKSTLKSLRAGKGEQSDLPRLACAAMPAHAATHARRRRPRFWPLAPPRQSAGPVGAAAPSPPSRSSLACGCAEGLWWRGRHCPCDLALGCRHDLGAD